MGIMLNVKDVSNIIRSLRHEYGESWNPTDVVFDILFLTTPFEIAPCRTISRKLVDDKLMDAKDLILDELPNQSGGDVRVPWCQFFEAVGRGRSDKPLLIKFEDDQFWGTRFCVQAMDFKSEDSMLHIQLEEVDPAEAYL